MCLISPLIRQTGIKKVRELNIFCLMEGLGVSKEDSNFEFRMANYAVVDDQAKLFKWYISKADGIRQDGPFNTMDILTNMLKIFFKFVMGIIVTTPLVLNPRKL